MPKPAAKQANKLRKNKKVKVNKSKNWRTINLLKGMALLLALILTVALATVKTYYDFRHRAQTPHPTPIQTSPYPTYMHENSDVHDSHQPVQEDTKGDSLIDSIKNFFNNLFGAFRK